MAQIMCACGIFQSDQSLLWAQAEERAKVAPVCPGCGKRIASAAKDKPKTDESFAQITVLNIDVMREHSLVSILMAKAMLLASNYWKNEPSFKTWLSQVPKQFVRQANTREFEAVIEAVPVENRILIYDYSRPDAPLVMVWLLPMKAGNLPTIVNDLRLFD